MSKVGIVTDSTNCLPPELIQEYEIRVAHYHVIIDGKDYRDLIDITPAEFYSLFPKLKTLPTTSTPSPGEYVEIFTELAKSTDSIACIIISRALSAAYKAAERAKVIVNAEYPNVTIELIDSNTAAGALGLVTLEAARAANEGKSLAEVIETARNIVPRAKYIAAFDTLKYLIKGGRAPKKAIIGEFLQVKPLIGLVDDTGLVISLGKERGKQKARQKLADLVANHADTSKPLHIIAHYSSHIEDANMLRDLVTSMYNCAESYVTELTPVMSAHTGPSIGLSFYS
ncbi:DegV family protein [Chloroflexota bacterium]